MAFVDLIQFLLFESGFIYTSLVRLALVVQKKKKTFDLDYLIRSNYVAFSIVFQRLLRLQEKSKL